MSIGVNKNIAVIDFETTGFNPYESEITEVALSLFDGNTGDNIGTFNHLVKIKADSVPKRVEEITGINKEMTEKYGIDISIVKDYLTNVLSNAIVVAHNYSFEAYWLDVVFDIHPKLFYDTLAIDRLERPNEKHTLSEICERESISLNAPHRALNDVKATSDLLLCQMSWNKDNNKKYLNTITTKKGKEDYRPHNVLREEPV